MSSSKRLTATLVGVLLAAAAAAGLTPAAAAAPAAPARAAATPAAQAITLITGDVVTLAPTGDGRYAATVRPGPGRSGIRFRTTETDDGVRVVPTDAVPLLAAGRLDAELFDVRRLLADGYGDATSPALPLIVESAQPAATMRTLGAPAATPLASLGAVAVRADKDALAAYWRTEIAAARTATTAPRIWLDGKVKPVLDRSTAQIGAPAAWQAGLDGRGVTVAVLDTGADPGHPDLAGRIAEARDFSDSADTADRFGHGTHVAATVAGSGAASGGTRKGVAPGARLLVGKVLGDDGIGYESSIIEGMEWAAGAGAKVVTMSLGGESTDGTDPMSAAVNRLSAGTLFVVAAGNEGADYKVGTPGVATSALTVGAVDGADRLAAFSSRGPRLGDEGLKPEITAPGVGIVAARAAGTAMGEPVDEHYTAASGTSMATPHVAGAAAVLAQHHPQWTAAQLKDALVSTAKTASGTGVYGQGAGRVDLARAVAQQVTGTGVADFGLRGRGSPVSRTVTYRNAGPAPVALTLREDLPAISVSAPTVTVPAGGSADVAVTFDLATAAVGAHTGWLTASGPAGIQVTTAIGGRLDPPHHKITVTALDRAGRPVNVPALQLFGDDPRFDVLDFYRVGRNVAYEVAEGDYLLDATIADGGPLDEQETLVTIPELRVDRDLTVVLDARKGRPIRIETPRPAEQQTVQSFYVHRVTGSGRRIANGFMNFSSVQQINVTPTAPLRRGEYEFSSRWQLVEPMVRADIPSVAGPLDINLMPASPAPAGTHRYGLVAGLGGAVRGKAVVLDSGEDEYAQVRAAAAAGAAVVLLVRPAEISAWSPWSPDGEERLPIPGAVVAYDDGQRILARAARPGASLELELTASSPYLYDVFQVSAGRVPDRIVHRVTAANSHRITTRYAHNGGFDWVREQRFGWRPWQAYSWNDAQRAVRTPSVREEWVSTGDSIWQHQVHDGYPWNDVGASLDGGIADAPVSYRRAGSSAETWYAPVVRPATPAGQVNRRTGDVLTLRIAEYVDSTDRHHLVDVTNRSAARLYRDGKLVAELPDAWRDVPVPAGDAAYRLTLDTARTGPDWLYGTATATEWTFRSAAAGTLPLLQISYAAPVTPNGTATSRAHYLGVTVPGARQVKVETSADEGATWTTARPAGSAVLVPAGTGTVSLRVTATDRAGNTVRQTIVRAYGRQ